MKTVKVLAGNSSSGDPVLEDLPVADLGQSVYTLLASPGLAQGIAKGDRIRLDVESGHFEVLSRGGNLAIQLFVAPEMQADIPQLSERIAKALDGTLDGQVPKLVVFSIPVSKGFAEIERVFDDFVRTHPGSEWYYGNVYYATDGVTPLNWWLH